MVDIPTLDIEDYDPDLNEETESTEDQSGGALTAPSLVPVKADV